MTQTGPQGQPEVDPMTETSQTGTGYRSLQNDCLAGGLESY